MSEHTYRTILHSPLRIYHMLFCSVTDRLETLHHGHLNHVVPQESSVKNSHYVLTKHIISSLRCTRKQTSIARNPATL